LVGCFIKAGPEFGFPNGQPDICVYAAHRTIFLPGNVWLGKDSGSGINTFRSFLCGAKQ